MDNPSDCQKKKIKTLFKNFFLPSCSLHIRDTYVSVLYTFSAIWIIVPRFYHVTFLWTYFIRPILLYLLYSCITNLFFIAFVRSTTYYLQLVFIYSINTFCESERLLYTKHCNRPWDSAKHKLQPLLPSNSVTGGERRRQQDETDVKQEADDGEEHGGGHLILSGLDKKGCRRKEQPSPQNESQLDWERRREHPRLRYGNGDEQTREDQAEASCCPRVKSVTGDGRCLEILANEAIETVSVFQH